MSVRKLVLRNHQSPGDIVMLTAAVRDLHLAHPGAFLTDVRTPSPQLWENNPYITPIADDDPDVEHIECHYPLIHGSNQLPRHFVQGFSAFLAERLQVPIKTTAFKGDIHLAPREKRGGRRSKRSSAWTCRFGSSWRAGSATSP